MRPIRVVAIALMFFLVFGGHTLFIGKLAGQTDRGLITGTVTDTSGAAIPGATVVVKSEKTGDERTAKSNNAGSYSVTNLSPASYSIEARAPALGDEEIREEIRVAAARGGAPGHEGQHARRHRWRETARHQPRALQDELQS